MSKSIIRRAIETRTRRAENSRSGNEAGFSLIELIVVVAILGILIAIAIPVFGSVQRTAADNAARSTAANAATQAASALAANPTAPVDMLPARDPNSNVMSIGFRGGTTPTSIDRVCVEVTYTGGNQGTQTAGPGCNTAP